MHRTSSDSLFNGAIMTSYEGRWIMQISGQAVFRTMGNECVMRAYQFSKLRLLIVDRGCSIIRSVPGSLWICSPINWNGNMVCYYSMGLRVYVDTWMRMTGENSINYEWAKNSWGWTLLKKFPNKWHSLFVYLSILVSKGELISNSPAVIINPFFLFPCFWMDLATCGF